MVSIQDVILIINKLYLISMFPYLVRHNLKHRPIGAPIILTRSNKSCETRGITIRSPVCLISVYYTCHLVLANPDPTTVTAPTSPTVTSPLLFYLRIQNTLDELLLASGSFFVGVCFFISFRLSDPPNPALMQGG